MPPWSRVGTEQALAGEEAGRQLDLELPDRLALALGEVAHAGVGEVDVLLQARRHLGRCRFDGRAADQDVAFPLVEVGGVAAHPLLAALANVLEDLANDAAGVSLAAGRLLRRPFEILDRHLRCPSVPSW
jgi:hypothetical protein